MKTTTAGKSNNRTRKTGAAVVDKKMKDYGKDPYFVKKVQEANAFLRKHGLPKDLPKK